MSSDNVFKPLHHAKRVVVLLVTATLALSTQVNAQPNDALLEEGVQILIEKHEIVHLKKTGQLDPAEAQQRLQANKQHWDKYSQKMGQWPKEKQQAFVEQLKKRDAAALATLQQKWNAESRQLQKDGIATQAAQESASAAAPQKDTSKTVPIGQSTSGPDMLGIRIGMKPEEVRAVFKSRGFGTSSCQDMPNGVVCSSRSSPNKVIDEYMEIFNTLAFTLPGDTQRTIPNTKYIESIHGFIRTIGKGPRNETLEEDHALDTVFAHNPGHEGIVSLHRHEILPPDKRPTFEAFMKSLSEKYGLPSYSPQGSPGMLYWSYDKTGTLRKPDIIPNDFLTNCNGAVSPQAPDWMMRSKAEVFQQQVTKCGSFVLFLIMSFNGGTYVGPNSIVSHYESDLVGYDAGLQAFNATTAIIDKAQSAARGEKVKQGQQQKPDL